MGRDVIVGVGMARGMGLWPNDRGLLSTQATSFQGSCGFGAMATGMGMGMGMDRGTPPPSPRPNGTPGHLEQLDWHHMA